MNAPITFPASFCLLLSAAFMAPAHALDWPPQLSGSLTLASEGVTKGVGDTDGKLQPSGTVQLTSGAFFTSARAKTIRRSSGVDAQYEFAIGVRREINKIRLGARATYKVQTGGPPGYDDRLVEYRLDASRAFGAYRISALAEYTPDLAGATEESLWVDTDLSRAFENGITLSGGVGTRQISTTRDYTAFHAGLSYDLTKTTQLDLTYYDTDSHSYGARWGSRTVLSLSQSF